MTHVPLPKDSVVAGRYRVIRALGRGGMGAVYEVEHVQLQVRRALKLLLEDSVRTSGEAERFLRGARNAARIQHVNVCQVHDFGVSPEGRQYLAMEFIPGESLGARLRRGQHLSLHQALMVAQGVASALVAAHELAVVHRDLKPDNVMLGPGWEEGPGVKVVDFDIARRAGDTEGELTLTRASYAVGTPEYMSPEQARGQRVDGRSDLYALGLLIYRMVAGELPFPGTNSQEIMTGRLILDPPPLDRSVSRHPVPPRLRSLVSRLLEREPEDRIGRAEEVVEALKRIQASTSPSIPPGRLASPGTDAPPPRSGSSRGNPPKVLGFSATAVLGGLDLMQGRGDAPATGGGAFGHGPEQGVEVEILHAPADAGTSPSSSPESLASGPRADRRRAVFAGGAAVVSIGLIALVAWAWPSEASPERGTLEVEDTAVLGSAVSGTASRIDPPAAAGDPEDAGLGDPEARDPLSHAAAPPPAAPLTAIAPAVPGARAEAQGRQQPGPDSALEISMDLTTAEGDADRSESAAAGDLASVASAVDELLATLAEALLSGDAQSIRAIYPRILESELQMWHSWLGQGSADPAQSLAFRAITEPTASEERAEVGVVMATIHRPGTPVPPLPFRLEATRDAPGTMRVWELRRHIDR